MRKVVLHIGLHKTGTSFIQKRTEANEALLPAGLAFIPRAHPALSTLAAVVRSIRSQDQAKELEGKIGRFSRRLARYCPPEGTVLISHEDLLGPVPTRNDIRGLYPFVEDAMPVVLENLRESGCAVEVVAYFRTYHDWLGSVFRHRFKNRPDRVFWPKKFKAYNDLPEDWQDFQQRLRNAVGETPLHIISFEEDRASGNLGTALYDIFGLPRDIQARFAPMNPVNVTDPLTALPAQRP